CLLIMVTPLLSVNWKEHSNILSTVCTDLFDNYFVDCTIAAEKQSLKAHRLILSACSPYFHMLFSEEREKHPILILKDVSFDALKNVIDFVYHGEIQIPKEDLKAFLELAESLQIKGLNDSSMKDGCELFIYDASGDACQGPSSDNQKDTFEVQSTSASHDRTESSFEQPPLYQLYDCPDTVQINSSPSFEERNRAPDKEKSILEMVLSQEKNTPVLPSVNYEGAEIKVKKEPMCVVLKCEQIDECDELLQEDDTEESCLFPGRKSRICDASRDMHQNPSCDDTFHVQSTSKRCNSTESSSEQPPHSDSCTDTGQTNSSLAFEESNIPCKKKGSLLEMALSRSHYEPMLPGMSNLDTQTTLKEEPLRPEGVFVKSEQPDECDENMQEDNADDMDEWGQPIFTEQNLDQYSSIASTHKESSNELLNAVRMPLIIGPSNAQDYELKQERK
ncbi:Ring canal kelch protein, partial [Gryllus bimaculatus]